VLTVSAALLDPLLKRDPVGPRITYYDDATGERIEVSTVTLANWAAKTANLLRDELGAGPSSRVTVLLPAHWQTAAVLLGAWWIGAEVVFGRPDAADIALCTADRLDEADAAAGMGEVVALSLDPFGKPVPELPIGVTDYATSVRVHGDQIIPERAPGAALNGRPAPELLALAADSASEQALTDSDRVLSTAPWDTDDDLIRNFLAVLSAGASLVQVTNADPAVLDRRCETEKVTRR
jgi:uncharacterized protein (TIGR03089 family)